MSEARGSETWDWPQQLKAMLHRPDVKPRHAVAIHGALAYVKDLEARALAYGNQVETLQHNLAEALRLLEALDRAARIYVSAGGTAGYEDLDVAFTETRDFLGKHKEGE
ncbi:MAG: hypothetical protein AAF661_05120 [Pseudomonadota bacterium]